MEAKFPRGYDGPRCTNGLAEKLQRSAAPCHGLVPELPAAYHHLVVVTNQLASRRVCLSWNGNRLLGRDISLGDFVVFDRRAGVDGVLADSASGAKIPSSGSRRSISALIAQIAAASAVVSLLAWLLAGPKESAMVLWSFAICIAPAVASLRWVTICARRSPTARIGSILGSTFLRLLVTPALAIFVWCVILSEQRASFWLWLVVGYALTLAAEVRLVLRVMRYDQLSPRATSPNSSGSAK